MAPIATSPSVVVMSEATTVLLIDDDPHHREYYALRLHASSSNYDVVQAATGRSGLDICARQPIDCVVLELDLPDMSSFLDTGKARSTRLSSRDRRDHPDTASQSVPVGSCHQERRTGRIAKDFRQRRPSRTI